MLAQVIFNDHTPLQEAYFGFISVLCYVILAAMFLGAIRFLFTAIPLLNTMSNSFLNGLHKKRK